MPLIPLEIPYPDINPVIQLGPVPIHWYGVMYVLGFFAGWWLGRRRAARPGSGWTVDEIGDLLLYVAVGVVLGGRLGYVLIYGREQLFADPLSIVRLNEGGMSFHGGLVGVIAAMWLYARRTDRSFLAVMDFIAPLVPPGIFFGRIGNFINGELWGSPTDLPWAMVFPDAGPEPRHPSMLYEALLEGLLLFALLWWFSSRPRPVPAVSGLFLVGYGVSRFLVEFVRIPDTQMGYLAFGWLTTGQLLSLPMVLLGMGLLIHARRTSLEPHGTAHP